MRSVADGLRREEREALLALSPAERLALALALGRRDLELFRHALRPPLAPEEAGRLLERQRQAGRRRCACIEAMIG
jgi:hypothetical protein